MSVVDLVGLYAAWVMGRYFSMKGLILLSIINDKSFLIVLSKMTDLVFIGKKGLPFFVIGIIMPWLKID